MLRPIYRLWRIAYPLVRRDLLTALGVSILLQILTVALLYGLNAIYGQLYQAINDFKPDLIYMSIAKFSGVAGVLVCVTGFTDFWLNRLAFAWRSGLTEHALSRSEYALVVPQFAQRVQEDLKVGPEAFVSLGAALSKAVLKLLVFTSVVISLTEYWVGAIILGSVIMGTWITRVMARSLAPLQSEQETNEAEFRSALWLPKFALNIVEKFHEINNQIKKVSLVQSGLGQMFVILPFVLLMPLYVSKAITMGAFFQSVNALSKIIDSLIVLIDNRQLIAKVETSLIRTQWLHTRTKDAQD